jgi:Carboxypeptidase regulatory-like domain
MAASPSKTLNIVSSMAFAGMMLILGALALPEMGSAQTELAGVSGRVTDGSGAVIVDAEIEIRNVETNVSATVRTNLDGLYTIPSVHPGHYLINVRKPGFKSVSLTEVELNVQDNLVRNFALQVGSVSETVTITGDELNINTTDASVSTVVDRQFVENLPLNGRSFQSLLYLTPGVNPNVGSGSSSNYSGGQFVVNGQRGDANYWMVDGVSANIGMSAGVPGNGVSGALGGTNLLGGTSALVSVDALQEFRIQTSTFAPEFGRAPGGQISIQTRSGTNRFHGALFEYLRNTVLDATDWFANANGLPKSGEQQNDFGGVAGGPIVKDKTFFFFSYEGLRVRQPQTYLGTVPDLASRQNAIAVVQPYLNAFPLPVPGAMEAGPGYVTYNATFSNPASANAYALRIDHQVSKTLNLFARYNQAPSSLDERGGFWAANVVMANKAVTKTATIGSTWTVSAQLVNDARFNYSVSGATDVATQDTFGGGAPFPSKSLFSDLTYQDSDLLILPSFGTSMNEARGVGAANYQHQYNLVDTVSAQKGSHSLKFGVDYRRLTPSVGAAQGQLLAVFSSIDDFDAGNSPFSEVVQNAQGRYLLQNLGSFGQDTWRIGSRLSLTYGLRWDIDFVPSTEKGAPFPALTGFNPAGLSTLALAPAGTQPYGLRIGKIAPRIGGAYRVYTTPDWALVFRGGFGIFYGLASSELVNQAADDGYYPFGAVVGYSNIPFPTPSTYAVLPPITPPNIQNGQTLFGFDPNLNVPRSLQWNVTLEQSLGKAQTVTMSYIGASDDRMLESAFISSPNSNYASALLLSNVGMSSYEALQLQYQRRLTGGLQALASYTWSHSIDNGSYGAYSNGNLANANANRGDSDFDLRNVLSVALTYDIPELRSNAFTRTLSGGWSLNNILQVRSGPPLDVIDGNFSALSHENTSVQIRPDVVPGQPFYVFGSQYPGGKALNPLAFTDPPIDPKSGLPLRQGNLGRNWLRSPGLTQWDFAVHRDFTLHEGLKLQFRAELFNLLNHPNFGPYNNYFQTGNIYFGESTQMLNQSLGGRYAGGTQNALYTPGGPRSGELALKLVF